MRVEVRHQRLHLPLQRGERGDRLRVLIVKETRRDGRFCTVSARRPGGGGGHLDGDARDAGGGASEGALGGARAPRLEASRSHASRLPNAPLSPYRTSSRISYGSCGGVCFRSCAGLLRERPPKPPFSTNENAVFFERVFASPSSLDEGFSLGARSGTAFTLCGFLAERPAERGRTEGGLRRRHRAHGGDVCVARGAHQNAELLDGDEQRRRRTNPKTRTAGKTRATRAPRRLFLCVLVRAPFERAQELF